MQLTEKELQFLTRLRCRHDRILRRTHRIGQTRPVHVYRMVSKGTIEEKVLALQDAKRELISGVLGVGDEDGAAGSVPAGPRGRLSEDDVRLLLS